MRSFGKSAQGERLERLHDLPLWDGERLRNIHPILPGLRDTSAPRPTLHDFVWGGAGRTPSAPLSAEDPVWGQRASPFTLLGPRRFQRYRSASATCPRSTRW